MGGELDFSGKSVLVVGGSITIGGWTIPGYIAIAAIFYAIAVSALTYLIGKPLDEAEVERLSKYVARNCK